jgi:hypothetical protein
MNNPCTHCKLYATEKGHDACLGTLIGIMNACCGHGDQGQSYVQFMDGSTVHGNDAYTVLAILKKNSIGYECDPKRDIVIKGETIKIKRNKIWEDSMKPDARKYNDYQSFVDAYFQFREKRGSKPRWSGKAGDTMKDIITYLMSLPKANGSEEKALLFWQYILDHWDGLTPYLKGRVQIGQINESIEEIIDRLKHKHENTKRPSSATKAEPGRSFGKL